MMAIYARDPPHVTHAMISGTALNECYTRRTANGCQGCDIRPDSSGTCKMSRGPRIVALFHIAGGARLSQAVHAHLGTDSTGGLLVIGDLPINANRAANHQHGSHKTAKQREPSHHDSPRMTSSEPQGRLSSISGISSAPTLKLIRHQVPTLCMPHQVLWRASISPKGHVPTPCDHSPPRDLRTTPVARPVVSAPKPSSDPEAVPHPHRRTPTAHGNT
jgi:hypothetical protein